MAEQSSYRVICFDLDGTLLPLDMEDFMPRYFKAIEAFAGRSGYDVPLFMQALKAGIGAMAAHEDDLTNKEAFWAAFAQVYGEEARIIEERIDDFYEYDFGELGQGAPRNPAAARAIATLVDKGYPVALLTMPMFPRRAVEHRLTWAGVDPSVFKRITAYDNSKAVKPRPTYFAENLVALGAKGSEVLMVGNHTTEDMTFLKLGADGYLITDDLLNPTGADLNKFRHSSLEDFVTWAESLPTCENPLTDISNEPVANTDMERAFAENAVVAIDREAASKAAAAVAADVNRKA